jgi:hypothetical protein
MHEAWGLRHLESATNWKMQLVLCDLRYLAGAANWEVQLDSKCYLMTKHQPKLAAVSSDALA